MRAFQSCQGVWHYLWVFMVCTIHYALWNQTPSPHPQKIIRASQWKVCYQRGLTRLVFSNSEQLNHWIALKSSNWSSECALNEGSSCNSFFVDHAVKAGYWPASVLCWDSVDSCSTTSHCKADRGETIPSYYHATPFIPPSFDFTIPSIAPSYYHNIPFISS